MLARQTANLKVLGNTTSAQRACLLLLSGSAASLELQDATLVQTAGSQVMAVDCDSTVEDTIRETSAEGQVLPLALPVYPRPKAMSTLHDVSKRLPGSCNVSVSMQPHSQHECPVKRKFFAGSPPAFASCAGTRRQHTAGGQAGAILCTEIPYAWAHKRRFGPAATAEIDAHKHSLGMSVYLPAGVDATCESVKLSAACRTCRFTTNRR